MYPHKCSISNPDDIDYFKICYLPLWVNHAKLDFKLFTAAFDEDFPNEPIWTFSGHSINSVLDAIIELPISARVRSQGLGIAGNLEISCTGKEYTKVTHRVQLTSLKKRRVRVARKLLQSLSNTTDDSLYQQTETELGDMYLPHLKFVAHPLILRQIQLFDPLPSPNLEYLMERLPVRPYYDPFDRLTVKKTYDPILFVDDLSIVRGHYYEISKNVSMPNPKLKFRYAPTSLIHYAFKKLMQRVLEKMEPFMQPDDLDELRWYMSEDRLYRYFMTQLVTFLHFIFEFLAFWDDWKFFVGRQSFSGISFSSIVYSQIRSIIIFLYLYDAGTSSIILFSIFKDILYNIWKVCRVLKSKVVYVPCNGVLGNLGMCIPQFSIGVQNQHMSEDEKRTSAYDAYATTHVTMCLAPAIVGLAIYSLQNFTYKSWWSWLISCLADSVYFFGFISMTPQLYINYKLKSVAHLPIRAFMYKIFNTFIDDIFAFLVTMPLKHRIMTLRDDVIFIGFVYQWWIYPADPARPNEFGFQYAATRESIKSDTSLKIGNEISEENDKIHSSQEYARAGDDVIHTDDVAE